MAVDSDVTQEQKRLKLEEEEGRELRERPQEKEFTSPRPVVKDKAPPIKCKDCKQFLDDPELKIYVGDADEAVSLATNIHKLLPVCSYHFLR